MMYKIYDKVKKTFLDSNIYYVSQKGIFYKINSPLPIRLKDQERYEVRIILGDEKNGD